MLVASDAGHDLRDVPLLGAPVRPLQRGGVADGPHAREARDRAALVDLHEPGLVPRQVRRLDDRCPSPAGRKRPGRRRAGSRPRRRRRRPRTGRSSCRSAWRCRAGRTSTGWRPRPSCPSARPGSASARRRSARTSSRRPRRRSSVSTLNMSSKTGPPRTAEVSLGLPPKPMAMRPLPLRQQRLERLLESAPRSPARRRGLRCARSPWAQPVAAQRDDEVVGGERRPVHHRRASGARDGLDLPVARSGSRAGGPRRRGRGTTRSVERSPVTTQIEVG